VAHAVKKLKLFYPSGLLEAIFVVSGLSSLIYSTGMI